MSGGERRVPGRAHKLCPSVPAVQGLTSVLVSSKLVLVARVQHKAKQRAPHYPL